MTPNIDSTEGRYTMQERKIQKLEISMVEIKGDVRHIRERIDNGLSATVTKVWDKLQAMAVDRAKLETLVGANSTFLDKLKGSIIWVSVVSIAGGVIGLSWKLILAFITNT